MTLLCYSETVSCGGLDVVYVDAPFETLLDFAAKIPRGIL